MTDFEIFLLLGWEALSYLVHTSHIHKYTGIYVDKEYDREENKFQ